MDGEKIFAARKWQMQGGGLIGCQRFAIDAMVYEHLDVEIVLFGFEKLIGRYVFIDR